MAGRYVIIGNGIAGTTAARHIRMQDADARITMVSSESPHFFARTALMYVYMGHLTFEEIKPYPDGFWPDNRIECVQDHVVRIDTDAHRVALASGEQLAYDRLLLATGSRPNRFGWPGEHLQGVQGLYSRGDLGRMEAWTNGIRKAVVVGGGLIGVEMAEMLRSRGIEVSFLVRERAYMDYALPPAESALVASAIRAHGVDLRLGVELDSMVDNGSGQVRGVRTSEGDEIECGWVGLATGVHPNVDLAAATPISIDRGFLVGRGMETSVPDVFAAGDCAQLRQPPPGRPAVEPLWYTGRSQGAVAARSMTGSTVQYVPGVFYNSAKFFDLEYMTYGLVHASGSASRVWYDDRRLLRVAFRGEDGTVTGFNALGTRLRGSVCEDWIRTGAHVDTVIRDLSKVGFDPEFSRAPGSPVHDSGVTQ